MLANSTRPRKQARGERGRAGVLDARDVRAMFDGIAGIYDLMNSTMTAGLHHRWRSRAADLAGVGPGSRVLDVATGTGDLAIELAGRVAPGGEVVGSDFAEGMLARARSKPQARELGVRFEWGDAMELPYPDDHFDAATVGFGARNFSDLARGIAEMARVVRPGGRVVVLEITSPTRPPLSIFFGLWFDRMVPVLGRMVGMIVAALGWGRRGGGGSVVSTEAGVVGTEAGAVATETGAAPTKRGASTEPEGGVSVGDAYMYLPSSVKRFPPPGELAAEMERAGLRGISWTITAGGTIAIHAGTVPSDPEEGER